MGELKMPRRIYLQRWNLDGKKAEGVDGMTWADVRVNKDDAVYLRMGPKKKRRRSHD